MALTDAWLKANHGKSREKPVERGDRDGLSIRVTPKGKVTFQMRFRYRNAPARLDLGSYPLLTLQNARLECQRLRAELEQGVDPRTVRAVERQAIHDTPTYECFFRSWYTSACVKEKEGHKDILRSFELHVFPRLGHLPVDLVTLHEWLDLLEKLAEKIPGIAERILTNAKDAYWWGIKRKTLVENPIQRIDGKTDLHIERKTAVRPLSDEELYYVWQALESSRISPKNKVMVKLLMAYACRVGELRLACKSEFDLVRNVWTVPAEHHKIGRITKKPLHRPITADHRVLLDEAMKLSVGSTFLFTNDKTGQRLGSRAHLSLPYEIQKWVWKHHNVVMKHWSTHDFRGTARTRFSKLTLPHVAEKMLGHKLSGVWEVYDHHDYVEEQAEAYRKWWALLMTIVTEAPTQ